MDLKAVAVTTLLMVTLCLQESNAKPFSLGERCWCRGTESFVPKSSVKQLKFLNTPNCPFQVVVTLKNSKEVCISPQTKWLQQYLKNALNK
ncbi:chemokine (C-X-C motif) ligand 12a (stromal cell-derived factor 1) isoform X2 [Lepisosteus oculatus]|nr:PREDICTED: stromal cell-derived factor 1 isoform X2 [Lepisosteus oculatus]